MGSSRCFSRDLKRAEASTVKDFKENRRVIGTDYFFDFRDDEKLFKKGAEETILVEISSLKRTKKAIERVGENTSDNHREPGKKGDKRGIKNNYKKLCWSYASSSKTYLR